MDEKFQLEERNTVTISQRVMMIAAYDAFDCNYSCKNRPGLSFHRIPATNAQHKLLQERWIQNIHVHFPCRKMKTFLSDQIISEKIASKQTLRI